MITLRPDQVALDQAIDASIARGNQNVMAVLPTGGGKSIVMSERVLRKHLLGTTQLIMAHRTELVGQMSIHIANRGIKHRIIAPKNVISQIIGEHRRVFNGQSFVNPDSICTVGAVDTIRARKDELKAWCRQVERGKLDEGHHALRANKWGQVIDLFPNASWELYTASPARADGQGLGRHADGVVDDMVLGPTMRELIDINALCDYQIVCTTSDFEMEYGDLTDTGDFSPKKMRVKAKKSHIVGDVVKEYIRWAYGKRTICFATDVETAGEIAARFNEIGIPAAAVSGETPSEVRNEMIRRFKAGQIWILINVDLFDEGFDVPAVEVVIMARPTASLPKYLQMFGRALRTMFGKLYGLIIDMVSNWKRHGLPDKPHLWSLDRREKRAKKEPDPELEDMTVCKSCSRPYPRILLACKWCGAVPPLPEPRLRTLEQIDGDLCLLDPERLAQMRNATILESPASVAQRVGNGAGGHGAGVMHMNRQIERIQAQTRLSEALAQWAGIQRWKGRDDRESYRRFYLATGVDVLGALHRDNSTAQFTAMAETVERWCHV